MIIKLKLSHLKGGNMEIKLERTCFACPEQYDAFDEKGNQVGYLRLRYGYFTVTYPDVNGKLIYEIQPKGDGLFEDDEREQYLHIAKEKIMEEIENEM